MIKPLNNNVLCELVAEKKKESVIIIPDGAQDKRMEKGKVLAVAEDVDIVKKGDVLYFQGYSLNPVEVDGKELFFIKSEDILAKA